jgi:alkanesulfonate monooxygenase SsuD/methylene tetrahydromethanopterin reductase-like flavin-dependent oxidoreductase (luciferase family)
MSTAIDLLSGGRFDLGIGAGWYQAEFDAFGYDFGSTDERFSYLETSVQAIRALFGEGPVDLETAHFQLAGAYNRPRPAQPGGPPIWIGGKGGDRQFRLVARHATGWNSVWRWSPNDYAERADALRRIARREGRDPATVRFSAGLYSLVGEDDRDLADRFRALQEWAPGRSLDGVTLDDYEADTLTGTTEACLERLNEFARIGVEEIIVSAASVPFAVYDWSMVELIAKVIIPEAHGL